MKKLFFSIVVAAIISSCATSNETRSSRVERRNEKKFAEQAMVKSAVESRRFIIKLDRLYLSAGMLDLRPRANYIIVDGEKAIINAAYLGRQWDIKPIAGINMRGVARDYELTNKISKGLYEISMKVENGTNSFDVYLTIGANGSCSASVNSIRIQNVRYRGYVVPIVDKPNEPAQNTDMI